jgi:hypothetical protein
MFMRKPCRFRNRFLPLVRACAIIKQPIFMPVPWRKEFCLAQPESPRRKASHAVAGFAVALVMGFMAPYLAAVPLVPVIIAFLYAYAGLVPAAACGAFALGAYALSYGSMGMLMGFVAHIAPAVLIVRGIRARIPFHRQIVLAVASLAAGTVAALVIAYAAVGSNIIGALAETMREALESMAKVYPGFVDVLAARTYAIPAAPESITTEILLNGFLSAAQRANYVDALLNDMQTTLALALPGYLLSMSVLAGVLAVAWPGYVKRGEPETNDINYVPLARWYTPYRFSLGMLATLAVAFLLYAQRVQGGDTLFTTIRTILSVVFMIQAASSIERRMQIFGARTWLRVVVILLIEILFGDLAIYYGGASALIGSCGAVKQLMEKRAGRQ